MWNRIIDWTQRESEAIHGRLRPSSNGPSISSCSFWIGFPDVKRNCYFCMYDLQNLRNRECLGKLWYGWRIWLTIVFTYSKGNYDVQQVPLAKKQWYHLASIAWYRCRLSKKNENNSLMIERCMVGWLTPQDAEIVFRHVEITVAKHEALGKWWEKGWSIKQSWLAFPCVSDSILYSILFAVLDRRWIIIARVVNIIWKYIRIPRFCWKLLICQRLWTHILLPTIFVHRFIPLHSDCFNEAWGIKNRYIHPPKKLTWPWRNYDGCWNHFPDSVWSPAYTPED